MISRNRIARIERDVKKCLNVVEVKKIKLRQNGQETDKEEYFEAEDRLDEMLDKLYSEKMMYLKENNEDLFLLYLGKKKDKVKKILMDQIKKGSTERLNYQRINQKIKNLIHKKKISRNPHLKNKIDLEIKKMEKLKEDYE